MINIIITAIKPSIRIPENVSDDCIVANEGNPPNPESEELKNNATNILFAICAPIAVSRPFSPKAIIPNINPNITAEIANEPLILKLVPLKKCSIPKINEVNTSGITGFLVRSPIACIKYPLKNISSKDACIGNTRMDTTNNKKNGPGLKLNDNPPGPVNTREITVKMVNSPTHSAAPFPIRFHLIFFPVLMSQMNFFLWINLVHK